MDGASRHDINQGELGNCWLLAAFSCLSDQRSKLETVLPPGQSFVTDYAGIFLFRFDNKNTSYKSEILGNIEDGRSYKIFHYFQK